MNPLFADTESFPNYWLLKASDESGREWAFRCIHEHGTLSGNDVNALYELLRSHTVITFNGLHYDQWMIAAALNGWSAAPIAPPPPSSNKREWKGGATSYEAYKANGWTDQQLIDNGLLVIG